MAKKKIKSGQVFLTARDMLNGYVAQSQDVNIHNLTPLQMIPEEEKDETWKKWNLDWLERFGLTQLQTSSRNILKNYQLANGILDKRDYVISPDNDMTDIVATLSPNQQDVLPIKFYPIIPNVVNVLRGEFSKRDSRIIAKAVDEFSTNEALEYKQKLLTDIFVQKALAKKQADLAAMGADFETQDPEQQKQLQQEMDTAKALAEAETKFKSYVGRAEQWANHILKRDYERFNMYELESDGFSDMLIADREFWHINITDADYRLELWEPWKVFYHKSPHVKYTADGNHVGRILMMSIPDVIDTYGHKMTEDQLLDLKNQYRTLSSFPGVVDSQRDQENLYTDFSKPYPNNYTNVTWQKFMDGNLSDKLNGRPATNRAFDMSWHDLYSSGNYMSDAFTNGPGMVRVTEAYWKSQKRVGYLNWIKKDGTIVQDIVDENYKVTEKPIYNLSLNKCKSKETLVLGEHIDWIWINEVRYGIKINSALSSWYVKNYSDGEPIYIGGDPIPFQFKSKDNIYGCKLPVEGRIFSERGSQSSSLVDKMKPHQISFNIVNNQIIEYLADEIGNVFVLDPNSIPRNSMGGEWGKHNYQMFHQVMKDHQIAAVDPSIRNTESATNFSHFQVVDLSKTNQIMTRIQLAEYFKTEAFAVVGITPQRVGATTASETATGVQQAVNNSYAQTEIYFDQHMNHLMPRVRQMMLDAAQFTNATKPKSRVAYNNSDDENIIFDIDGYELLLRQFDVYSRSTADVKALLQKLEQLAMQMTSAGGSLVDIAQVMTSQSPAEIISKLREGEAKREQQVEAQREHEQQLQQQQQAFIEEQDRKAEENENYWKERDEAKEIYIAEIKALGFGKDNDLDSNNIPDVLEVSKFQHLQGMDAQKQAILERQEAFKQQKQNQDIALADRKLAIEREKMKSKERIEKTKLKNKVAGEK